MRRNREPVDAHAEVSAASHCVEDLTPQVRERSSHGEETEYHSDPAGNSPWAQECDAHTLELSRIFHTQTLADVFNSQLPDLGDQIVVCAWW